MIYNLKGRLTVCEGFDEFENKFVIDKVKDWCEANSIEYTVAE